MMNERSYEGRKEVRKGGDIEVSRVQMSSPPSSVHPALHSLHMHIVRNTTELSPTRGQPNPTQGKIRQDKRTAGTGTYIHTLSVST